MKLLKITAGLFLLVQSFRQASLQDSTDSPGRTIDKSWWRGPKNPLVPEQEAENNDGTDAMESNADYSGIASGSMAINSEEEQNISVNDKKTNETSDELSVVTTSSPHGFHNGTKKKHKHQKNTVSPTTMTTNSTNSSQINMKEDEFNSAESQNSTGFPDFQSTTLFPEINTTHPDQHEELNNSTEGTNATSVSTTAAPTTAAPEINQTTTTNSSTAEFPPETSDMSPTSPTTATPNTTANATTANPNIPANATTAANPGTTANESAADPNTPEKSNNTDKSGGSGSSSERGLASDPNKSTRHGAWGAVLGTAVAVALVGLVAYIILKKKHQKAFSHRKLVEDFPADPVLRLDNNEPLDLNFGGSAYYNPGLQGDNIQMSNIPGRP